MILNSLNDFLVCIFDPGRIHINVRYESYQPEPKKKAVRRTGFVASLGKDLHSPSMITRSYVKQNPKKNCVSMFKFVMRLLLIFVSSIH
jgi:hypothetical protein